MSERLRRTRTTLRWSARILSLLILLFWGFVMIAHLTGDAGRSSRPLISQDYFILASLMVALAGLAIAWRWELLGASISLLGFAACAFFNWRVVMFPGTLIPFTAILFFGSSLVSTVAYSRLSRSVEQGFD